MNSLYPSNKQETPHECSPSPEARLCNACSLGSVAVNGEKIGARFRSQLGAWVVSIVNRNVSSATLMPKTYEIEAAIGATNYQFAKLLGYQNDLEQLFTKLYGASLGRYHVRLAQKYPSSLVA